MHELFFSQLLLLTNSLFKELNEVLIFTDIVGIRAWVQTIFIFGKHADMDISGELTGRILVIIWKPTFMDKNSS